MATRLSQTLAAVIERVYASTLSDYQSRLSKLEGKGSARRFLCARMGSTGSVWLAKLLDSHPDVYCSHEGILARVHPAAEISTEDVLQYVEYFAWDSKHDAYAAIGDVGSVWASQLAYVPFGVALLVRHPARLLKTRLGIYPSDQSFTQIDARAQACIREVWGIEASRYDPVDQIFLNDVFIFASQMRTLGAGLTVIALEGMRDPEYCRERLRCLTGLDYDAGLIEQALAARQNRRVGGPEEVAQIVESFTPRQRRWYKIMLREVAAALGYDLGAG